MNRDVLSDLRTDLVDLSSIVNEAYLWDIDFDKVRTVLSKVGEDGFLDLCFVELHDGEHIYL